MHEPDPIIVVTAPVRVTLRTTHPADSPTYIVPSEATPTLLGLLNKAEVPTPFKVVPLPLPPAKVEMSAVVIVVTTLPTESVKEVNEDDPPYDRTIAPFGRNDPEGHLTRAEMEIGTAKPEGRLARHFPIVGVRERYDVLWIVIAPSVVPKLFTPNALDNGSTDITENCVLILLSKILIPSVKLPVYEKARLTRVPGFEMGEEGRP